MSLDGRITAIAPEIVTRLLRDLVGRAGFCGWWDTIDRDTRAEILATHEKIIEDALLEEL